MTPRDGGVGRIELTAVTLRSSERWAVVAFVDPASREIYGDVYLNGDPDSLDAAVRTCAAAILSTLRQEHLSHSGADGKPPPRDGNRGAPARNNRPSGANLGSPTVARGDGEGLSPVQVRRESP